MSQAHYFVGGFVLLIALIALWSGRKAAKNAGLYSLYVEAQRLSELSAGVPGFFSGVVTTTQTLKTPYTQKDCVYYSYQVEQQVQHRDEKGNVSTSWESMGASSAGVQFALQQGSEQVQVNPEGIDDVDGAQSQQSLLAPNALQGLNLGGLTLNIGVGTGGGSQRIDEKFISPGMQITVGGQVFDEAGVKTFRHDTQYPLVLTTKTKEALVKNGKNGSYLGYGFGVVGVIGGIVLITVAKF